MRCWRVLNFGKTTVYIHPVMPLYALYAMLTGNGLFMALSTISILLHEAAHALTATAFGQAPTRIELTPLGAIMHLEDASTLPTLKRAGMLLAGPSMTFVLCWFSLMMTRYGMLSVFVGRTIFLCNISILVVNLLPALPLDGGSLLALLLEQCLSLRLVNRIMRVIGSILGCGMILLNVYASWKLGGWNLSLAIAGCCLLYSAVIATRSQAMTELRYYMDRKIAFERNGAMKIRWIAVPDSTPLRQLLQRLPPACMAMFAGFEAGSMKPSGWLTENEVIQHYLKNPQLRYSDVVKMHPDRLKSAKNGTI